MRIVFSRKGFDSAAGGGPSPIVEGRPVSLPIPAGAFSQTTYAELGLADHVALASKGRLGGADLCHHDPMFLPDGTCLFGQCGAAQTHLANQGVGIGDVFLFFGLFRDERTGEPHHRLFGFLEIAEVVSLAGCSDKQRARFLRHRHPHAIGLHAANDAIYCGRGCTAATARDSLRLTVPGGPPSLWNRPSWLRHGALSYHHRRDRWLPEGRLRSVARGQEFVADVAECPRARSWLAVVLAEIGLGSSRMGENDETETWSGPG